MTETIKAEEMPSLVGRELEPSPWFEITQERVNQFADATNDHQFIHIDPDKAAQTPFGGPIAHGFLTLSLVSYFSTRIGPSIDGVLGALNYGRDRHRFLNPVPVASSVHARSRVVDVTEKSTGVLLKQEIAVHVVGDEKPALVYESLGLLLG